MWWLLISYGLMSCITYLVYAKDKRAARSGGRRVPERILLLLGLACGWPGALLAQRHLHHKTRKRSFQWRFWLLVLANSVLLGAVLWLLQRAPG